MAIRIGVIFCSLLLGCFALPTPKDGGDLSTFFEAPGSAQGRIVGGRIAAPGSHPWLVAFTQGGPVRNSHCGGSILSLRTVLTAGHCVWPVRFRDSVLSTVRINAGTNQFRSGGQSHTVSGARMHPQYVHAVPPKNDIAILYTTAIFTFNQLVRVIPLNWEQVDGGMLTRVAGWGFTTTTNTGPASPQLRELETYTISSQLCSEVADADPVTEICTFHSPGRGTCSGDSGSALVRLDTNEQIGVVSWGFPCAVGGPDVFARVAAYQSWIQPLMR